MKFALLSVFDKTGIAELAKGLRECGFDILSSGGTAKVLCDAGIAVREVSEYTGFPEMMDGRVKTLHPKIHAGILFQRANLKHVGQAQDNSIAPIDLVVVNLYPFEKTAAAKNVSLEEIIENIDVGGPAMVRAAAKNYGDVGIITDPSDYARVLAELRDKGRLSDQTRSALMRKAFALTASYDAAIASFFERKAGNAFPEKLSLPWEKTAELRYGENPHQKAALYRKPGAKTFSDALVQGGKELSFNNILDADSAWALAREFSGRNACAVIKHNSPCGVAIGKTQREAWEKALAGDPVSAFGGVVAFNSRLEEETAGELSKLFLELVIAPGFEGNSLEVLGGKKNVRVIDSQILEGKKEFDEKTVLNGLLVQESDAAGAQDFEVVTKQPPSESEQKDLDFAWIVAKHVKSNAIVLAKNLQAIGLCGGQPNRVDCIKISGERAKRNGFDSGGSALASDGFFPFKDSVELAGGLGVKAIMQPGGSVRDAESISECDSRGIAMVFTKTRHFRH